MRVPTTTAVLAAAIVTLTGCAGAPPPTGVGEAPPAGIAARGLGIVTGAPDLVTVVLAVQTAGPSARGVLDANNRSATALIDTLKGRGVAAADLQTSELAVNPTYNPTGRINGYEVTNQVTARLRDISAAGTLIDAAADAAGDSIRVQQLSFSVDDDSMLRAQARTEAVRLARAQATQLAEAAGVSLGRVLTITEVPVGSPGPIYRTVPQADAASAPVEPGTQKLTVTVEVVYAIDQ